MTFPRAMCAWVYATACSEVRVCFRFVCVCVWVFGWGVGGGGGGTDACSPQHLSVWTMEYQLSPKMKKGAQISSGDQVLDENQGGQYSELISGECSMTTDQWQSLGILGE